MLCLNGNNKVKLSDLSEFKILKILDVYPAYKNSKECVKRYENYMINLIKTDHL
jgi:hypothetical protein